MTLRIVNISEPLKCGYYNILAHIAYYLRLTVAIYGKYFRKQRP